LYCLTPILPPVGDLAYTENKKKREIGEARKNSIEQGGEDGVRLWVRKGEDPTTWTGERPHGLPG